MLKPISVFDYRDYRQYLRDALSHRRVIQQGASLRQTAQRIGFKAPSQLTMILGGKRRLPIWALEPLSRILKLSSHESKYFEGLIQFNHAKNDKEKSLFETRLKKAHPQDDFFILDMESFRAISDPIHFFLMEMTRLKDFRDDPKWMQSRLGGFYTLTQVKEAYDRLFRLGLLEKVENKVRKTQSRLTTSNDILSTALRSFHKQSLQRAILAIDKQTVDERDVSSSVLTLDTAKLKEAKNLIKEFRRKFCQEIEAKAGSGLQTYQINIQLIRITEESKND